VTSYHRRNVKSLLYAQKNPKANASHLILASRPRSERERKHTGLELGHVSVGNRTKVSNVLPFLKKELLSNWLRI
jgi:hypothetical protein